MVVVAKRPRCPTHDRSLVRLSYQGYVRGRKTTITAPWFVCPEKTCLRVFPETKG